MKTREYTIKETELIAFKKRHYVRRLTLKAISEGRLIRPEKCEICDCNGKIEAHHKDYGQPFDVKWLCKKCHSEVHKKNHALNPENNVQTPMPYIVDEYKFVTITLDIPIKNYLYLQNISEQKNKPITKILRETIKTAFPVYEEQLTFDFEEKNDDTQNEQESRICSLEENEKLRSQSHITFLQQFRREGGDDLQRVGRFWEVCCRYGTNA